MCANLLFVTYTLAAPSNRVTYNPPVNIVQGNQPLSVSYVLTITSPSTLTAANPVTVNLGLSVLSKPSVDVTDAAALAFISLSPAALTYTGPNQSLTTTVTINVPLGHYAGDYAYKILPAGWPVTTPAIIDLGATVNARVSPPTSTDTNPPAITLLSPGNGTGYVYAPATGTPVIVPVSFTASVGAGGQTIDSLQLFIDDTPVALNPLNIVGLGTTSASATASIPLTVSGLHTVKASATNENGTSWASSEITVAVLAPPPTLTVASPTSNYSYSYTLGTGGVTVPVHVTANSVYGNITALAATLNGSPITLNLSGVGTALNATGSVSLPITSPGTYSLNFTAANAYGEATPVTVPFTVTGTLPAPTVSILTPAAGTLFTRTLGDPATLVNYTFEGGTSYGTITNVTVKLDGAIISPSLVGLNTATVSGSGVLSFTAGGAHTLTVTVQNEGGTATASTNFSVQETRPPQQVCGDVTWLPPISLNKTIHGGSVMPIKFTLECHGKFVRDPNVVISIYEVFANGSSSEPVLYPYGTGSPNPAEYAITGNKYHLNFDTANGTHHYQIDVYTTVNGTVELLDSKVLNTR